MALSRYKAKKIHRVNLEWHECADYLNEYMEPLGGNESWEYPRGQRRSQRWHGGSWKTMQSRLRKGDLEGLDKVDELLDLVESTLDLFGVGPEWMPSVVGSSPRVAAYLQGAPNAMNRYVPDQSPRGALNIWIGTAVSASVSRADLAKKGVACVALARAVSTYRPVNVYAYDNSGVYKTLPNGRRESHDVLTAVRMPTSPLDLSSLMACVSTISTSRGFFHNAAHVAVGNKAKPEAVQRYGRPYDDIAFSRATVAELLNPGPDDLVVANSYGPDLRECLRSPMAWIQKQMRLALKGEGVVSRDVFAECEVAHDSEVDQRINAAASTLYR